MKEKSNLLVEDNPDSVCLAKRARQKNGSVITQMIWSGLAAVTACKHEPVPPSRPDMNGWQGYEAVFPARHAGSRNDRD